MGVDEEKEVLSSALIIPSMEGTNKVQLLKLRPQVPHLIRRELCPRKQLRVLGFRQSNRPDIPPILRHVAQLQFRLLRPAISPLRLSSMTLRQARRTSGRPIDLRNSCASSNSLSFRFASHPSSSDMISMTRGRHSRVTCTFRKESRVRRATKSVALRAYSLRQA